MKHKLIYLFILLLLPIAGMSNQATSGETLLKIQDARFYAVATADLDGDGTKEIIAAGQKGSHIPYSGFVVVYKSNGTNWSILAREMFEISHQEKNLSARVRSLEVIEGAKNTWTIYTTGRSGSDEEGTGFLRQASYDVQSASFKQVACHVFFQEESKYTHGYPMAVVKNMMGKKGTAVAYGGFFSNPKGKGDLADVRLFMESPQGKSQELQTRPFAHLAIPLRVNALTSGDLDGDGRGDLVIAGRSHTGEDQYAALALHLNGQEIHGIIKDSLPSRLRTLLLADLDGEAGLEIISGGRTDVGDLNLARLDWFSLDKGVINHNSRYCFTADGSTRLRALVKIPGKAAFLSLGRAQLKGKNKLKWHGFIAPFKIHNRHIAPAGEPHYYSFGKETRFRSGVMMDASHLLTAGFTLDKAKNSTAFVLVTKEN